MRLSKRIHAIVNSVSHGETIADIGTDHGYVPMLLIRKGISPYVIMSDISEYSLSKAKDTFKFCGINTLPEQFRVGDGLTPIRPAEVDNIIIAGLGGMTIISILNEDPFKTGTFKKLILQPRKHSGELRYFLYTNGWDIINESLAPEGKFVCEIIKAIPSGYKSREPLYNKDDIRWSYPVSFLNADAQLIKQKLTYKLKTIDEGISNLSKSHDDKTDTIAKLSRDKIYIIDLLTMLKS